jgi:bacterioferritin-associated ferredoxin
MQLDDKICYCFHVSKRKILNFLRVRQPRVPSQLSECGSAGTGCGWCVPFLKNRQRHPAARRHTPAGWGGVATAGHPRSMMYGFTRRAETVERAPVGADASARR